MRYLLLTSALCAGLALPNMSSAFVPVKDPISLAELTKMVASAKEQIRQLLSQNLKLDDQTLKMIAQLKELKSIHDQLKDGFDLNDLLAGLSLGSLIDDLGLGDLAGKIESAKNGNWEEALGVDAINGTPVTDYIEKIYQDAGISSARVDELAKSGEKSKERIADGATTSAMTSAAAERATEQTTASLVRTKELVDKIDDASTLREAMDLNTRMTAEMVFALVNLANMEAILTVAVGQMGVLDSATMADDEKFLSLTGRTNP